MSSAEKIEAYEKWLEDNGVVKPQELRVSQVQWGVGVTCNKPLAGTFLVLLCLTIRD